MRSVDSGQLEWIREPQQQRSKASLQRVLVAAEELFGKQGFDRTSVAQIAAEAKCAVGTVYARFKDKESLLHVLHQRLCEQAVSTARRGLGELPSTMTLDQVARTIIGFLLHVYAQRPKLIWAIYFRIPHDVEVAQRAEKMIKEIAGELGEFFSRRDDLSLESPGINADFVVRVIFGAVQQRGIYREVMALERTDEEFTRHLAQAMVGYLKAQTSQ